MRSRARSTPRVTVLLVLMNVLAFMIELRQGANLEGFLQRWGIVPVDTMEALAMRDLSVLATFFTAAFLHVGWLHLLINVLYLGVFGSAVERVIGSSRFLLLYVVSAAVGGLAYVLSQPSSSAPAVGASAAVAGVIGAHLALAPGATLGTLAPVLFFSPAANVSALLLLVIWLVAQLVSPIVSLTAAAGVAWWAHLGGFLGGLVLAPFLRPPRRRW